MPNLVIGFSTPKKFHHFSWLISTICKTKYSHSYIKLTSESIGRDLIYQASGFKVNFIGSKSFYEQNTVCIEYTLQITEEQKVKLLQKAIDLCGSSYSLKEVFGLLLVKVVRVVFSKHINNPFNDEAKWFCAELVGELLTDLGILNLDKAHLSNLEPKDIADLLAGITING